MNFGIGWYLLVPYQNEGMPEISLICDLSMNHPRKMLMGSLLQYLTTGSLCFIHLGTHFNRVPFCALGYLLAPYLRTTKRYSGINCSW